MNKKDLEEFKKKFYRSGDLYVDITDKRPDYADEYERIISKYRPRIKSINSLLEFLLDMLSTDDIKKKSLFIYPFGNEKELDSNYPDLIPWESCLDFFLNFDEIAVLENDEPNFKQFYNTVLKHYDLYKDFIRAKYDEFKNFIAYESSNSNESSSNLSVSSDEIDTSLSIGIKNLGNGKTEITLPKIELIKDIDFNQVDLSSMFNDDDGYQEAPVNLKWIGDHFFELLFNTAFEKKAFLLFTLYILESKLIEEELLSYFYKNRLLGVWFVQDRIGAMYKLKMYSCIVSFFDNCKELISPYSILSNDTDTLVWVAYYFDSQLRLNPNNKNSIKKRIINYYRRIYRIMLFIQSGMEYCNYSRTSVDYESELKKLIPNDTIAFAKALVNTKSNCSVKNINSQTLAVNEISAVLRKVTSMFPDIFDEDTIETWNEIEEEFLSKEKIIREQDDRIKKLESAYNSLNNDFNKLKEKRESLTGDEYNEEMYQLLDDLPYEDGKKSSEYDGVGINNISPKIWNSFTTNTQQSIKAAFTLVNQANLPIDLAVLSILRCIEIEFVSKIIHKFSNQFYKNKSLEFFNEASIEGKVHLSLVHAIKNGSFTLGEMENLGEFLSSRAIQSIKSPLVKHFIDFLDSYVDELCSLCSSIKACNEKGESSNNCSHKFLNDYEAVSIRELRNKIAHGDKKITKIDKITFKRIYLAMIEEPLKILVHIVLLSEQINKTKLVL